MKSHRSTYRLIRKRMLFILALLLLALFLCAAQALRAKELMDIALDGRNARPASETESDAYSAFRLREQMNEAQAASRISGWLTIADVQQVELKQQRGRMHASLYSPVGAETDAPVAIVMHGGMGSDSMQVQDVACELSLRGYRVLTPDAYAHGKSDGRYTSLGLSEAKDLRAWIDWILLQDPDAQIVVLAFDDGAAAALYALEDGLPQAVRAVAADSAYVSIEIRALQLLQERLGRVSGRDWKLFNLAYRALNGADIKEGDMTQCVSQADCPMLFIHGTGDQDVPAWHSEDLALAAGGNAQLLLIEGASHMMARFADPQAYYDALLAFFADALK